MVAPIGPLDTQEGIDAAAHVVQVALTPVFLLSGIGTLLNMFNTRQNRISDQAAKLNDLLGGDLGDEERRRNTRHLRRLRNRRLVMDAAVLLGALGGASTCAAAFVLFLGSLRDAHIVAWLVTLFGGALFCTIAGLLAFVTDCVLAWHGLRMDGPMPHMKS